VKRWKSLLGVLLLFVLGFLSGMAFDQFTSRRRPPSPNQFLAHIEANVVRELKLNPEQKKVFDSAIQDAQRQLEELHRSTRPKVAAILDAAQDKLLPVLTEKQKAILAEMRRSHKERMQRFESRSASPDEKP
jgi:Spy/CpxP family protein refolding chaperone